MERVSQNNNCRNFRDENRPKEKTETPKRRCIRSRTCLPPPNDVGERHPIQMKKASK